MSSNFLNSSHVMNLANLRWNAFSITVADTVFRSPTMPTATPVFISTLQDSPASKLRGATTTRLATLDLDGAIIPAWAIPGAVIKLDGNVGGVDIGCDCVIQSINPATFMMDVLLNKEIAVGMDGENITDGAITLCAVGQKFMLSAPSDAVKFAVNADKDGANPGWFQSISSATGEYEITAPVGSKFDFEDLFFACAAGANKTLMVRFL